LNDSTLLFLRYELDADGHAYQLLALGGDDEVRRRAFAHFYQHAICDNDVYRAKAQRSLERLIARLGEAHGER